MTIRVTTAMVYWCVNYTDYDSWDLVHVPLYSKCAISGEAPMGPIRGLKQRAVCMNTSCRTLLPVMLWQVYFLHLDMQCMHLPGYFRVTVTVALGLCAWCSREVTVFFCLSFLLKDKTLNTEGFPAVLFCMWSSFLVKHWLNQQTKLYWGGMFHYSHL